MTVGFNIEELVKVLNGSLINEVCLTRPIIDFEYDPLQLKDTKNGTCFISISNRRWNEVHRKETNWNDGNKKVLDYYTKCDLIITEELIEELKNKIPQIIVENSYQAIQLIGKAARKKMGNPVIGITGSVGKSSTRLVIEHLLKDTYSIVATRGNHNTQAGVPLYGAKLCRNPEVGVLEISLNALNNRGNQSLTIKPSICIVTSIGEAHLSTLHSTKNIAKFKSRIFDGLENNGLAIINKDMKPSDFSILYKKAKEKTERIRTYSLKNKDADIFLRKIIHAKYKTTIIFNYKKKDYEFEMKLPSNGAIMNTLGALLCLAEMGYRLEDLLPKIFDFQSLHRVMELKQITTSDGRKVDIIDDSHNAAIPSMINALETFKEKQLFYKGNKILVLGQIADLGEQSKLLHDKLVPIISASGADYVFGHGKYMREVIRKLPTHIVGGWFNNARELSRHVPYYCSDNSLIVLKGSVSGSDFRATSHLLPSQLKRSKQMLTYFTPKQLAGVLQPTWGALGYDLIKEKKSFRLGYSGTQAIEGLSPIILLLLLINKGIKHNEKSELKKWPTNKGYSIDRKPFRTGQVFSHRELMDELKHSQHPSAIFELAHIYYGNRKNAMGAISKFTQTIELTPEATLNLTGRFRAKEQQYYVLDDLVKIGRLLFDLQFELPVLIKEKEILVKGLFFGKLRFSCIAFISNTMVCISGMKSIEELRSSLHHIIKQVLEPQVNH